MKSAGLLLALAVVASGCSSVQSRVRGELLVHPPAGDAAPRTFRYEAIESHSIMGTAVGCLFTFPFYGGFCWGYAAAPYDSQDRLALEHARDDAHRIGRCAELVGLRRSRTRRLVGRASEGRHHRRWRSHALLRGGGNPVRAADRGAAIAAVSTAFVCDCGLARGGSSVRAASLVPCVSSARPR